jgi:hypothetical protein
MQKLKTAIETLDRAITVYLKVIFSVVFLAAVGVISYHMLTNKFAIVFKDDRACYIFRPKE